MNGRVHLYFADYFLELVRSEKAKHPKLAIEVMVLAAW